MGRAGSTLRSSAASFAKYGKAAAKGIALIGAAAAAAGIALIALTKHAARVGDQLWKASQKVGMSTEELSKLRYAADLSGVEFEKLEKGLGRLARNVSDASYGLETYTRVFDSLGISIKTPEGKLRSLGDLMPEIVDKFSRMEDGTKKTALAMELFGRTGADLIPMMNLGAAGMAAMGLEAEELGQVFTDEAGKASEAFNDALNRLGKTFGGLKNILGVELAPAITEVADRFAGLMKKFISGEHAESFQGMVESVRDLITAVGSLGEAIAGPVTAALRGVVDAATGASLFIRDVMGKMPEEEKVLKRIAEKSEELNKIHGDGITQQRRRAVLQELINELWDQHATLLEETKGKVEDTTSAVDQMTGAFEAQQEAVEDAGKGLEDYGSLLEEMHDEYMRMTLEAEELTRYETKKTREARVEALEDWLKAGVITFEQWGRATEVAYDNERLKYEELARERRKIQEEELRRELDAEEKTAEKKKDLADKTAKERKKIEDAYWTAVEARVRLGLATEEEMRAHAEKELRDFYNERLEGLKRVYEAGTLTTVKALKQREQLHEDYEAALKALRDKRVQEEKQAAAEITGARAAAAGEPELGPWGAVPLGAGGAGAGLPAGTKIRFRDIAGIIQSSRMLSMSGARQVGPLEWVIPGSQGGGVSPGGAVTPAVMAPAPAPAAERGPVSVGPINVTVQGDELTKERTVVKVKSALRELVSTGEMEEVLREGSRWAAG